VTLTLLIPFFFRAIDFVEITIERNKRRIGSGYLYAEDTIDNVVLPVNFALLR